MYVLCTNLHKEAPYVLCMHLPRAKQQTQSDMIFIPQINFAKPKTSRGAPDEHPVGEKRHSAPLKLTHLRS